MSGLYEKATPRPWRAAAMGGSSTVLCSTKPKRNDTRIPPYAYREEHCVAYPFIEDHEGRTGNQGDVRLDFVCFSHDDAALIVHAVNNIETAEAAIAQFEEKADLVDAHIARIEAENVRLSAEVSKLRVALCGQGGSHGNVVRSENDRPVSVRVPANSTALNSDGRG